jgi:hydrogenase maturation protease
VEGQVTVIGIGNTLMGDDGVGVRVAESLEGRNLYDSVAVVAGHTAGMALVDYLIGSDRVIFVDAIAAGDHPGSVFRFDPADVDVGQTRSHTSHGLGIGAVLQAAALLGATPDVVVYAIQVGTVRPDADTLSPEVALAAEDVTEMIEAELRPSATHA